MCGVEILNDCCLEKTCLVEGDGLMDECCLDKKIRAMGDGVVALDCGEGVQ